MPYKKFYTLEEYNAGVERKEIVRDFDYTKKDHEKKTYKISKIKPVEIDIVFVLIPISCPKCMSKMWDAFFNSHLVEENIQNYIDSPYKTVVCLVCSYANTRKVPGKDKHNYSTNKK